MQTTLSHIQVNVNGENMSFYRDLFAFLGWKPLYDDHGMLGLGDTNETSVWFVGQTKDVENDYDGPGANHLAIGAAAQGDVDAAAGYLRERGVELLFETPRHRPEFSSGEDQTYYQVMFASPDRVLFEVVYTGAKSA